MMSPKKADRDTTIEDIHRLRREMAARFGGDIAALLADARKRQEASGKAVWHGPSLKTPPTPAVPAASANGDVVESTANP